MSLTENRALYVRIAAFANAAAAALAKMQAYPLVLGRKAAIARAAARIYGSDRYAASTNYISEAEFAIALAEDMDEDFGEQVDFASGPRYVLYPLRDYDGTTLHALGLGSLTCRRIVDILPLLAKQAPSDLVGTTKDLPASEKRVLASYYENKVALVLSALNDAWTMLGYLERDLAVIDPALMEDAAGLVAATAAARKACRVPGLTPAKFFSSDNKNKVTRIPAGLAASLDLAGIA